MKIRFCGVYCDVNSPFYGHVFTAQEYVNYHNYIGKTDYEMDFIVDEYILEDRGEL